MTSGSRMKEMMRISPPQRTQWSGSTSKMCFNISTQRCLVARSTGQSGVALSAAGEIWARVRVSARIPALRQRMRRRTDYAQLTKEARRSPEWVDGRHPSNETRTSRGTAGPPGFPDLVSFTPVLWNLRRHHSMTVRGCTMNDASRRPDEILESQTPDDAVSRADSGRFTDRWETPS